MKSFTSPFAMEECLSSSPACSQRAAPVQRQSGMGEEPRPELLWKQDLFSFPWQQVLVFVPDNSVFPCSGGVWFLLLCFLTLFSWKLAPLLHFTGRFYRRSLYTSWTYIFKFIHVYIWLKIQVQGWFHVTYPQECFLTLSFQEMHIFYNDTATTYQRGKLF